MEEVENKPYKKMSKKYIYRLIEEFPNDYDLGRKLREYYLQIKKQEKESEK